MRLVARLAFALTLLAPAAVAQEILYTLEGPPVVYYANVVRTAGDVNRDGFGDYLLASNAQTTVHSGPTGDVLYAFDGSWSPAGEGNVDGDGHADLLLGGNGVLRIIQGSTGETRIQIEGSSLGLSLFGESPRYAGDLNGDGFDDLIVVGRPDFLVPRRVLAFSGANGSLLYEVPFQGDDDGINSRYAETVAVLHDVDGDGVREIGVSDESYFETDGGEIMRGRLLLHSGADGSLVDEIVGNSTFIFPMPFCSAGDVDGDGTDDILASNSSVVRVFSGATLQELYSVPEPTSFDSRFGESLSPLGDIDGDGKDDFLAGAPGRNTVGFSLGGTAYVFSGATGEELRSVRGDYSAARFGESLAGIGDVDDDGKPDFVINSPQPNPFSTATPGRALAISSVSAFQSFCTQPPNDTGAPTEFGFTGSPSVSVNELVFTASPVAPNNTGLVVYGLGRAKLPLGDGTLCIGMRQQDFVLRLDPHAPVDGVLTHVFDADFAPGTDQDPVRPGSTWVFQWWHRSFAPGSAGFTFSSALEITFQL